MKEDLHLGDLIVVDDGDLGMSIYLKGRERELKKLCFVNKKGSEALKEWL